MRRRALVLAGVVAIGVVALLLRVGIDGGSDNTAPVPTGGEAADFSERFTQYKPASEPNGDLDRVVWPDYVLDAGAEVKALYEFQVTHGELMRYMPCFCNCGRTAEHRNNRDCYIQRVNRDGSVVFDSMAPTWGVCLGVTRDVMTMLDEGMSPRAIRTAIDAKYAGQMDLATPTPYPPA